MVISRSNSEHIYGFNLTILLASAFCIRKGTTMYQNGQSFFFFMLHDGWHTKYYINDKSVTD
jgi:hypothetical protein